MRGEDRSEVRYLSDTAAWASARVVDAIAMLILQRGPLDHWRPNGLLSSSFAGRGGGGAAADGQAA
jgi:hypothetical protein